MHIYALPADKTLTGAQPNAGEVHERSTWEDWEAS